MRTIKELLELLKQYTIENELDLTGLCYIADMLETCGIIDIKEYDCLLLYIDENRPNSTWYNGLKGKRKLTHESPFYWKRGELAPRVEWCNLHIKKNS